MLAAMLRPMLALTVALSAGACSTPPVAAITIHSGTRTESLSAARLAELPQVEVAVGEAKYAGPRLRAALLAAGVTRGVDVAAVGSDGYRQVVNADTVERDDVIVAFGVVPADGPLRLVVPGSPGLSVRSLVALEATPAATP